MEVELKVAFYPDNSSVSETVLAICKSTSYPENYKEGGEKNGIFGNIGNTRNSGNRL